jgi:hypothetical protein
MDLVLSIFEELPAGAQPDWTYRTFRNVWRDKGLRLVHMLPQYATIKRDSVPTEQELETFMCTLFRSLVDMMGADYDLRTKLYALYALYTLHETQITTTKFKINLPQEPVDCWKVLLSLRQQLEKLPVTDPVRILKKMVRGDVFHFSLVRQAEFDLDPLDMISRVAMKPEKPAQLPDGLEDVRGAFQLGALTAHRTAYQEAMDAVNLVGGYEDPVDWLALAQKTLRKHDTLRGALSRAQASTNTANNNMLAAPQARLTNNNGRTLNDTARALANRVRRSASEDPMRSQAQLKPAPPGPNAPELARINAAYVWRLQNQCQEDAPENIAPFLVPYEAPKAIKRGSAAALALSAHGDPMSTTALIPSPIPVEKPKRAHPFTEAAYRRKQSLSEIAAEAKKSKERAKADLKAKAKEAKTTKGKAKVAKPKPKPKAKTSKEGTKKKMKKSSKDMDDDDSSNVDSDDSRDTSKKGKKQKAKKKEGSSAESTGGIEAATSLVSELMADIERGGSDENQDDNNNYEDDDDEVWDLTHVEAEPKHKAKAPPKAKPPKALKPKPKDAKPTKTKPQAAKGTKANGTSEQQKRVDVVHMDVTSEADDDEVPSTRHASGPSIEEATGDVANLMASIENDEDEPALATERNMPAPSPKPKKVKKSKEAEVPKEGKKPKAAKPKADKQPVEEKQPKAKKPKKAKQPTEATNPEPYNPYAMQPAEAPYNPYAMQEAEAPYNPYAMQPAESAPKAAKPQTATEKAAKPKKVNDRGDKNPVEAKQKVAIARQLTEAKKPAIEQTAPKSRPKAAAVQAPSHHQPLQKASQHHQVAAPPTSLPPLFKKPSAEQPQATHPVEVMQLGEARQPEVVTQPAGAKQPHANQSEEAEVEISILAAPSSPSSPSPPTSPTPAASPLPPPELAPPKSPPSPSPRSLPPQSLVLASPHSPLLSASLPPPYVPSPPSTTTKRKVISSEDKVQANGTAKRSRPEEAADVALPSGDDSDASSVMSVCSDDDEAEPDTSRGLLDSAIDDADDVINSLLGSDSD